MIDHAHSLWTRPIIQPFGKNNLKNHFFSTDTMIKTFYLGNALEELAKRNFFLLKILLVVREKATTKANAKTSYVKEVRLGSSPRVCGCTVCFL